jgi:hypothetical protein
MVMRLIKLRRSLAGGFVGALVAIQPARAQQIPSPLRYEVRAWPDAAILTGAAAATLVPRLLKGSLPHATCAPCDRSGLWRMDRGAVGPLRSAPARVSDVLVLGTTLGGAVLLATTRSGEGGDARREDFAVLTEAVGLTSAATDWMKVLFHRPRPVRYSADALNYPSANYGLSFPSGHTSQAFAAAAAYASILHRRGVAGRHRTEIAALFTTAAATGVMRVLSRKHFPTDVIAGALLGTAIGWTIPALHAIR